MGAAELIPLGSSSAPDGAVWDSCRAGSLLSGCSMSCCVPRRPSGIPEEDVRSTLVPYFLKHRSYLRRVLREKEEENRKVAESVLMGRDRIAELQQLIQARQQAWQVKTDQTKPNQTNFLLEAPAGGGSVGPGMTFKPSTSPRPP